MILFTGIRYSNINLRNLNKHRFHNPFTCVNFISRYYYKRTNSWTTTSREMATGEERKRISKLTGENHDNIRGVVSLRQCLYRVVHPKSLEDDYKDIPQNSRKTFAANSDQRVSHTGRDSNKIQAEYSRNTCCWNCGDKFHKRNECREPRKVSCSFCRREKVTVLMYNCPGTIRFRKTRKSYSPQNYQSKAEEKMASTPVLTCPDFSLKFILQTDASDVEIANVLSQKENGRENVVPYASRTEREAKFSTTVKECLAIIWATHKYEHYLEGYEFTVVKDHLSLKWLMKLDNAKGRLGRWLMTLQQYKFIVEYRKGSQNVVPDALSRDPVAPADEPSLEFNYELAISPDPNCSWYTRKRREVHEAPSKYPDYTVINDKLLHHAPNCLTGDNWRLCIPTPDRERVLLENHASPLAGHLGVRRTIARIQNLYHWPGMSRDVQRFVGRCQTCLELKVHQQKPAGYMYTEKKIIFTIDNFMTI